jgi:hypothetical protein
MMEAEPDSETLCGFLNTDEGKRPKIRISLFIHVRQIPLD